MKRPLDTLTKPNILVESRVPPAVRAEVYERDGFTCRDCGASGKPGRSQGDIQVYHVVALRDGGDHSVDNLITVCYSCRRRRDDDRRKAKPVSRSSFRWRRKTEK